jgi:hypothetical protein
MVNRPVANRSAESANVSAGQGVAVTDTTSDSTASAPVMPVAAVTVDATAETGLANAI